LLFRQQAATLLEESEKTSVMEMTTSWKEEGIEIGKEKGIEIGRERECQLILRLLRKKVAPLDPEWEARIRQFSFEQLEELGEASVDFTSRLDLKNWLAAH